MKRFLIVVLSACVFTACKKDDENKNHSADGTDYTSVRQYDVNAVYLGNIGDAKDDYRQENWPDWVYNAFAPLDTVNLTGYLQSEITIDRLYPNPCGDTQTMKYFAVKPTNLKIMIIDEQRNVHYLRSFHLPNSKNNLGLSYKGLSLIPGAYYRIFYGFSAEGNPFFMRGHIDILKDF